ncbi:MAG: hypothetical protein IKZ49_01590 [Alphaproteobacteria bacterium]|nr:hypothetical protein [Alphaproteobacteria bacterium]
MKRIIIALFFSVAVFNVYGSELMDLNIALQNTYRACVDIDDDLHELKVLAGVNTGITAVGTGAGVGAVATGFAKAKTDKEIDKMESYLRELEESGAKQQHESLSIINISSDQIDKLFSDSNDFQKEKDELEKLNKKSKTLGNWRTGLMATNTATNIASAIIANKTRTTDDLQEKINKCIDATKGLNNAILSAKMSGEDVREAQAIYTACREYEFVDIKPINKRGTGAMVASSVGAVVGGVGTITSGVANSDTIRDDNSDEGKQKEKGLNTASNVLAIGATASSATATIFNATQIAAIKKVAKVSESCTGVLK